MNLSELFEAGPHSVDWGRVAKESPPLFMLAKSILDEGIKEPILIKDGKVVDGIHRMFVLWLMGFKEGIPVKEIK